MYGRQVFGPHDLCPLALCLKISYFIWQGRGRQKSFSAKGIEKKTSATFTDFEDGGSKPQAKECMQFLEAGNIPQLRASKKMGASVLQPHFALEIPRNQMHAIC